MLTKTDLKEIQKIVNSSKKEIVDHVDKKIDDKIDGLAIAVKNKFDVVDSRFDGLESDMSILKSDITDLKIDVSVLKTDMKEVKGDLKSTKRTQLSHETRLVNLEA